MPIWLQRKSQHRVGFIAIVDKITQALQNGDTVIGIFLDFSKVFDNVNHLILLQTSYRYGIRGSVNDWFTSYLPNRKQLCLL